MTFDTFDSYNTDEAYKDKGSTAKGLVDAYKKDNPNGSADDFYAKLNKTWAQDKDGHVKNAVNEAFNAKEEVKEEPKAEAPKVEEMTQTTEALKSEEPKKEEPKSNLSKADKNYMDSQSAIIDEAKRKAINDAVNEKASSYKNTLDTLEKQGEAFRNIDDKLIDQLPTFMWRRYQNGEFGDISDTSTPEGRESKRNAQLRLAYFGINNIVSKLKMIANADAAARGQGTLFQNTESAYDQYQNSNLVKGLENRWNKYKTETNNAMNLLINRGLKEEELTDAARTIAQNQNLQTAFNMVDENKKAYILEVVTKLGDKIGNMNDKKFVNLILGMASSGSVDPSQAAEMIGIRAGGSLADKYNLFDDNGNIDLSVIKDLVRKFGKETVGNMLGEYGVDIDKFDFDTAGVGEGGVINNVVNAVTDKGNTYKEEGTKKGNVTDKLLGLGNVNMSDETMNSYYALSERRPEGITTDLPTKDIILKTMSDYPDKGVVGIVDKSGTTKAINKQFSEIDNLASQATKEFKKDGNLEKYQNRMKELYDYRNELQAVFKKFGKAPIPGNSIQSDYDKAFSNKEANFRKKYSKQ